jgi:hypothetical protein
MTTPATVLRPYSLGELLDQAIRLYRRNFVKFLGIMAIIQVPISLLQLLVSFFVFQGLAEVSMASTPPSEQLIARSLGGGGASLLLTILSFFLVQGLATAALTRSVADNYLGRQTGILDAYRRISSRWLSLVRAILLVGLLSLVLVIWTLVPCIGWVSGLGMLLFTSTVLLPLVAPIVILEGCSAVESIRRAWELARRRFWWILGFVFILFLFAQLLITGPGMLASTVLGMTVRQSGDYLRSTTTSTLIQSAVTLLMSLLYLPLQLTAITLMYFDLRVRTEGFDLTVLASEASGQPADVDALTTQAPAISQTRLITWQELGYFVIITFIGIALYVVFIGIVFGFMSLIGYTFGGMP